ncbi:hypothetical protein LPA46_18000 [Halobacterium sp. KA-6]|nr:hypothetical protein [Halobacterium sp. KA-6]MCD2205209.1 hypothetical protein [Halobacterium sp. KA-6]
MQKANLQPANDASTDQIGVDETMIRMDDLQYYLYIAVNPDSNQSLIFGCLRPQQWYWLNVLAETLRGYDVEDPPEMIAFLVYNRDALSFVNAVFQVDHAQHLETALLQVGP